MDGWSASADRSKLDNWRDTTSYPDPSCLTDRFPQSQNDSSRHAAVKKLFLDRFRMGRRSIVFRSKGIVWGVEPIVF